MQRMFNGLFAKNTSPTIPPENKAFLMINTQAALKELLNTYLSVRITEGLHGWANVDVTNPPLEGVQHDKLAIVANLARNIPFFTQAFELNVQDIRELKDFVAELLALESHEREVKSETSSPFGTKIASLVIKQDSLLERTMHAMRSFILEQFKRGAPTEFANFKADLSNVIQKLTSEIESARKNPDSNQNYIIKHQEKLERFARKFNALVEVENGGYHHQFFNEVIKARDQRIDEHGKPTFEEQSFNDYCNNIILHKRRSDLLNQVLISMPASAISALQNSSTFTETIDTPLAVESKGLKR